MSSGSVTHWIEQIKEGDESVAERELWDRYFSRLVALARKKLHDLPTQMRDDEDVALSAMNSFFLRAKHGSFPHLHDRTDLWQLLARITVRRTVRQRRQARAQKRGYRQVHADFGAQEDLRNIAGNEPTPDMLAAINEECQRLMNSLDDELRQVARMKLEGYTTREIAEVLGRVQRTVERKLKCIRQVWSRDEVS